MVALYGRECSAEGLEAYQSLPIRLCICIMSISPSQQLSVGSRGWLDSLSGLRIRVRISKHTCCLHTQGWRWSNHVELRQAAVVKSRIDAEQEKDGSMRIQEVEAVGAFSDKGLALQPMAIQSIIIHRSLQLQPHLAVLTQPSITRSLLTRAVAFEMAAPNFLNAVSKWAIPVFIGVSVGQSALYDVKGGTRAVIFDRLSGVKEEVKNEGTHFLIPWLQKAIIYDVRTKPRNISTTTGSRDLQMISLTLRILHRPEVQQLPKIYQVRQFRT